MIWGGKKRKLFVTLLIFLNKAVLSLFLPPNIRNANATANFMGILSLFAYVYKTINFEKITKQNTVCICANHTWI